MKDQMILADGTAVELEAGSSLSSMQVLSESKEEMSAIWEKLTEQNLKRVTIQNGDGVIIGEYTELLLVSETSVTEEGGQVRTSFALRAKTATEKRLDALEDGQVVQDGALADLGEVVSEIAGGGE